MYRPLTDPEVADFQQRLQRWQSPKQFNESLGSLTKTVGMDYLLLGPTDFREAHVATWCADEWRPDEMRLFPEEYGDFELKIGGVTRRFEVSEALLSDRRRDDEVKMALSSATSDQTGWEHVSQERMNWEDSDARKQAVERAQKKAQGKYDFELTELVIYLNAGWTGHAQDQFFRSAFDEMKSACTKFRQVWIVSNRRLVQIADGGERCSMSWIDEEQLAAATARAHDQTPLDELLNKYAI